MKILRRRWILSVRIWCASEKMNWVSLGGGLAFTKDGYPLDKFSARLKNSAVF